MGRPDSEVGLLANFHSPVGGKMLGFYHCARSVLGGVKCDDASSSRYLAVGRWHGRLRRVRRNRHDGSTGWATLTLRPGATTPSISAFLKMAYGASATALARMSSSSTVSLTASWSGCPRLLQTWSSSAWTSSSPGPLRMWLRP